MYKNLNLSPTSGIDRFYLNFLTNLVQPFCQLIDNIENHKD